ncbi:MAG: fatty acid--CoA ligase family protein, partial [Spirochaetota bacterium]
FSEIPRDGDEAVERRAERIGAGLAGEVDHVQFFDGHRLTDRREPHANPTGDGFAIDHRMRSFGGREAISANGKSTSYFSLLQQVDDWYNVLQEKEIQAGSCGIIQGEFSIGTVSLLIAMLLHKQIIVPLQEQEPEKELKSRIAQCQYEFTFQADGSWDYQELPGTANSELYEQIRFEKTSGLIIFTSGSTGVPKGAVHNANQLLQKFHKQRSGFRTITFLLLDHIGGINSLLAVLSYGGTVIPVKERTAKGVAKIIQDTKAELLPTTPTFLKMILMNESWKQYDLTSLKLVTFGTEPMPDSTLHALEKIFPNIHFKQTYGLTELGIMPVRSPKGDSRWFSIGGDGFKTRIVDGILHIHSHTSMLGYLNAPSPFDRDGWYNTGDRIEEKDGYIRVLGRDSEIINVGGEKVFPIEVEDHIMKLPNIKEVAVVGRSNPIMGKVVVARVQLKEPASLEETEKLVRDHCSQGLSPYMVPAIVTLVEKELHGDRFKKIRQDMQE